MLVEAGDDVFAMFESEIREYTRKALEERGVEVMLGETVARSRRPASIWRRGLIDAHTLVWGAGLHANPVGARWASNSHMAAGSRSSPI